MQEAACRPDFCAACCGEEHTAGEEGGCLYRRAVVQHHRALHTDGPTRQHIGIPVQLTCCRTSEGPALQQLLRRLLRFLACQGLH